MADDAAADPVKARPFGVRFDEAIRVLHGKLPEASLRWDSLAGPVHAKVFTVAGSTSVDLVKDLQAALVGALERGETITTFRKAFDAAVQEYGWAYNGKRGWRTQLIFSTNMRTAHMAGRWQQLLANAERRPYLQYRTAGDARVRPQHRAWNGQVHPINSAFWASHYPPNGWGCRCTVRAYSAEELQRKGIPVADTYVPATAPVRSVRNAAGELVDEVPLGIDPGWDHNVGQAWIAPELALGEKLARLPRQLRGPLVERTISPAFQAVLNERWAATLQAAAADDAAQAASAAAPRAQVVGFLDSRVMDRLDEVATTVPGLRDFGSAIAVSDELQPFMRQLDQAHLARLPQLLREYRAVLFDGASGRLSYVLDGQPGGQPFWLLELRAATDGSTPGWVARELSEASAAELRELRARAISGRLP